MWKTLAKKKYIIILPSTTIHLRRRLVHLPRWIELSVAIRLQRNSTSEGRSALIFSVETAKQNKSTWWIAFKNSQSMGWYRIDDNWSSSFQFHQWSWRNGLFVWDKYGLKIRCVTALKFPFAHDSFESGSKWLPIKNHDIPGNGVMCIPWLFEKIENSVEISVVGNDCSCNKRKYSFHDRKYLLLIWKLEEAYHAFTTAVYCPQKREGTVK